MPPNPPELLERLRQREAPGGGILPDFGGLGIGNVARTVLDALDVDADGCLPALDEALVPPELGEDVDRVLLLVVDGLGYGAFREHLARPGEGDGFLTRLARGGRCGPATSTLPSTTATALPTLYTGLAPATHGFTGPWAWLPGEERVVNLLRFTSAADGESLEELGFAPRDLLPHPTLTTRAAEAGVGATVVTRNDHAGSPLTRALHGGATVRGYRDLPELVDGVRAALDDPDGPGLVVAYWDAVDVVGHAQGPASDAYREALSFLDRGLGDGLGHVLEDPGTLVLATADHGVVPTPPPLALSLDDHPELQRWLRAPPTGDARARFLHVRAGREEDVRGYVEARFPHGASVVGQKELAALGAYGPGDVGPVARERYGDLALVARGGRTLAVRYGDHAPGKLPGHHGGWSEGEMVVPLLAQRGTRR